MKNLNFTLLFALLCISAFATQEKKQVKLRIQAPSGNLDEATLYFDQGINSTYNFQEDAQKVFSSVAGVSEIYSVTTDNIPCSINGFGTLSNTETASIGIRVDSTGIYKLTSTLLDNFDPTSIIRLEDRDRSTFVDLRANFYETEINISEPETGRFFLHVSYPRTIQITPAGCLNNDGTLTIKSDSSVVWTNAQLLDAFNQSVGSYNNVTGEYNFTGLAEGDYYMVYSFGSYTTTEPFRIGGNFITADIATPNLTVYTYEDVNFSAVSTNSNQFEWDFGDGTLIFGVANPILSFYSPGVFTVNLICSNTFGCLDNAQVTITVLENATTGVSEIENEKVTVTANAKSIAVEFSNQPKSGAKMQVFDLLGKTVFSGNLTTAKSTISLNEQPTGYYLVSVTNNDKRNTKRIFLGN